MPAGKLLAAYAYEVAPRQTTTFTGGEITANVQLEAALDSTFDRSKIATAPVVSFEFDTTTSKRLHPIRDAALAVAFGTGSQGAVTAGLAQRLADSMDNRSKPALLMVSVHDSGATGERRVLLWTFPQQEVFNLHLTARGKPKLDLLEAFNRESSLRKVALIDGHNTKTGMLSARVLDFQATATEKSVSDLWIAGFLAARLQMNSAEGTKLLARVLRTAHTKTTDDQQAQDQLLAAITALRVAPNPRQSLDQIERTYLTGTAAAAFRAAAGSPEVRAAVFPIDADQFDHLIQYTRFHLDNGVVVSAPFAALDPTDGAVKVTEDGSERRLQVEGRIEQEQVRTRA